LLTQLTFSLFRKSAPECIYISGLHVLAATAHSLTDENPPDFRQHKLMDIFLSFTALSSLRILIPEGIVNHPAGAAFTPKPLDAF